MPSYERPDKPRKKLKPWQWWLIIGAASLVLIATAILFIFFHQWIFTENTACIVLIVISVLATAAILWMAFEARR